MPTRGAMTFITPLKKQRVKWQLTSKANGKTNLIFGFTDLKLFKDGNSSKPYFTCQEPLFFRSAFPQET